MGICLVLGSGWGEALVCQPPGSVRENTADRFCSWTHSVSGFIPCDFLLIARVILRVSVSTEETGSALCWIGLLRRTQPSLRTDTQTIPDPVCYLSRIFSAGEYTWKNTLFPELGKKVDQGFFPSLSSPQRCCRISPWQDTWFPLSKRRSSFVNSFGIFFFLERLLLSLHGCPQFKRSRLHRLSCGLYYLKGRMWNEAIFIRPRK